MQSRKEWTKLPTSRHPVHYLSTKDDDDVAKKAKTLGETANPWWVALQSLKIRIFFQNILRQCFPLSHVLRIFHRNKLKAFEKGIKSGEQQQTKCRRIVIFHMRITLFWYAWNRVEQKSESGLSSALCEHETRNCTPSLCAFWFAVYGWPWLRRFELHTLNELWQ